MLGQNHHVSHLPCHQKAPVLTTPSAHPVWSLLRSGHGTSLHPSCVPTLHKALVSPISRMDPSPSRHFLSYPHMPAHSHRQVPPGPPPKQLLSQIPAGDIPPVPCFRHHDTSHDPQRRRSLPLLKFTDPCPISTQYSGSSTRGTNLSLPFPCWKHSSAF